MSGQFPLPQAGSPVTMNSFPGWNQPGKNVSSGTPQSAGHGMPPQPLMQPLNQAAGSPPKPLKFLNTAQNGASSHVPTSVVSQSSPSSLAENLRQNFLMNFNMNQTGPPSKFQSNDVTLTSASASSGSMDLSRSPRTSDGEHSKVASSVVQQTNSSVISSPVASSVFNGEVLRTSSVIANSAPLLSNKGSDASVQSSLTNVKQGSPRSKDLNSTANSMHEDCANLAIKMEPGVIKTEQGSSPPSSNTREPPLKKLKEEGLEYVNSTVIVGSSNCEKMSDTKTPSSTNVACQGGPANANATSNPPPPPAAAAASATALDVESQLEALFAGIADDGNAKKESKPPVVSQNLQGTPNVAAVLESKGSSTKKGKGRTNGVSGPSETTPKKRRKKKPAKDKPWNDSKNKISKKGGSSKGKYVKEASCDSGSNASSSRARGPVVHIQGTKDAPTSLAVVNAPARQDDEENENKKKSASSRVRKIHVTEGKLASTGLCGNSLVSRYESHSSDPRWVCVFCKKSCHIDGLGDLFGPYLIHHDTELERSLDLDADLDRRGGDKKDKKNKRIGLGQTGVLGLLAIPPLPGEQPQFMVYFHEYCAVWSPSINLIGSRLAGVQEAVWVAVRTKCSLCFSDGANIGCIQHGCSLQVHFPCAQGGSWSLDEGTFMSACHVHKKLGQTPILPVATIL